MKEFNVFSTAKVFKVIGFDECIHENVETVYIYHHANPITLKNFAVENTLNSFILFDIEYI